MTPKRKHFEDDDIEEKLGHLDEFMNGDDDAPMRATRVGRSATVDVPLGLYRKIAFVFIVITAVLLTIMLAFTATHATVSITPKKETVMATLIRTVNGVTDRLEGAVIVEEADVSKSFSVTQGKQVEGNATGKIKIVNETEEVMSLIPRTRFQSAEGVIFRMSKRTDVPARGSAVVSVVADVKGSAGEVPAGKFTIPGLSVAKQKVVYGVSSEPMRGGIRIAGIVTGEDVAQAESTLLQEIKTKKMDEVTSRDEGKKFPDSVVNVEYIDKTASAKVGDDVDQFTITGKVRVTVVLFDIKTVDALTRPAVFAKVPEGMRLQTVGEVKYDVEKVDTAAKTASLRLTREGIMTLDPGSTLLQTNHFANKSKEEIEQYLKATSHVERVQIIIRPRWRGKTPMTEEKIKIKLETN